MTRPGQRLPSWLSPARITVLYALAGALWIFLSDRILGLLVDDARLSAAQTLKGWAFIAITAFSLWLLLRHAARTLLRAEAARKRQARVLGHLVDRLVDYAVIGLDPEGRVHTWNRGAEHITGRTASVARGNDLGFLGSTDGQPFDAMLEEARARGTASRETWWTREKDGPFWGRVTVSSHGEHSDGIDAGFVVIIRDLSDYHTQALQVEAEGRRLAESLAQRTAILDALPVQLALLEPDGRIGQVNRAWQAFAARSEVQPGAFDVGADYLSTCRIAPGRDSRDAEAIETGLRGVLAGSLASFEREHSLKLDEGTRWFRLTACPISGNGAVVMHVDISDQRAAAAEIMTGARQQQTVAILSQVALERGPDEDLYATVAELTASAMEISCTAVLRQADEGRMNLIAGAGWPSGTVGSATVSMARDSLHGRAVATGTPCLIRDTQTESTPQPDAVVIGAGLRSCLVVPVPRRGPVAWVIGCYDRTPGRFGERHIEFLEAISYVIASAIERRLNEADLREQRARLESVFRNNADGLVVFGANGVVESINPAGLRILAREEADVIGADVRAFIPNALAPEAKPDVPGNSHQDFETDASCGNGETVPIQLGLGSFRSGDRPMYIGTFRDLTERKRAQALLERLGSIVDAAPDLIGTATTDGRIQYVNPAGRRLLGIDPEFDITALTVRDVTPEESVDQVIGRGIPAAIREGTWQGEARLLRRDGTRIPVSQVIIAHRAPEGDVVYLSTVCRDLSLQHAAEQQLRHAQKMESLGQLVGGIAHDFNNFLTVILGNAELLRGRLQDQEDLAGLADLTRLAAERGAELTHRLLAFSRNQVLSPVRLDPDGLIRGLRPMLQHAVGEKIGVELRLAEDGWPVLCDQGELESALLNLAINARDAMAEGGALTVETANVDLDERYVERNPDARSGEHVRIAVEDTGCGMSEEIVERAFEPFFTTKEVGRGTGLGLSMVYGFVKQSGGHVRIHSTPGQGTRVELYLPRAAAVQPEAEAGDTEATALPRGNERILVVEDDELVRTHITRTLEELGYAVVAADNASTALARLRDTPDLDLVFSDIVMPGDLSGLQLAEEIHRRHPGLPVMLTTGQAGTGADAPSRLRATTVLLRKPYRKAVLARAIRNALDAATS